MPITAVQVDSGWQVGNTITWQIVVTDGGGNLSNLGADPLASLVLPDGTVAAAPAPTVTKTSTGRYQATYVATQPGRHRLTWSAGSGGEDAHLPFTDHADVWPTNPRYIISLADARASLNQPATARSSDDEIGLYIAAATEVIEDKVGAVLVATKVETRSGSGRTCIALNEYPTAITSVTENGITLAPTGYTFDEVGLLWRGAAPGAGRWSANAPRNVVITYTVGSGIVPPGIVKAARELVKHQYSVTQLAARPSFDDGNDPGYAPSSSWFAVLDALAPHAAGRVPGFA
jgi:hypothetical protein